MKKSIIAKVLAISMVVSAISFVPTVNVKAADNVPVYRICSLTTNEHLYTTDKNEVAVLSQNGWRDEGISWLAPASGKPVYRVNQPGAEHLYTTDKGEMDTLISKFGWVADNGGNPLFYSGGDYSILRLYNKNSGSHLLTADRGEFDALNGNDGWVPENSGIYALGTPEGSSPAPTNTTVAEPEKGNADITNVDSLYAIEGDMKLSGSGTGCHAKFLVLTPTSAVSFGLQYDKEAIAPYTGKTMFMSENVAHNFAGGQQYDRWLEAEKDKTYHVMLTIDAAGNASFYVNGNKLGSVNNPELVGQQIYLRCEGSARLHGDSVTAEFSNIKLKGSGVYDPNKVWGTYNFDSPSSSIHSSFKDAKGGTISGTLTLASGDWDSAYDQVSGSMQFVE